MNWNPEQAKVILRKVEALWPKAASYTDEEFLIFQRVLGQYPAQDVIRAIEKAKARVKKPGRPTIPEFESFLRSPARGLPDQNKKCPTCAGRLLFMLHVYPIEEIDATCLGLQEKHLRRHQGEVLLDVRLGRGMEREPRAWLLGCPREKPRQAVMTTTDWFRCFGENWGEFPYAGDEEQALLSCADVPRPATLMSFSEYREVTDDELDPEALAWLTALFKKKGLAREHAGHDARRRGTAGPAHAEPAPDAGDLRRI